MHSLQSEDRCAVQNIQWDCLVLEVVVQSLQWDCLVLEVVVQSLQWDCSVLEAVMQSLQWDCLVLEAVMQSLQWDWCLKPLCRVCSETVWCLKSLCIVCSETGARSRYAESAVKELRGVESLPCAKYTDCLGLGGPWSRWAKYAEMSSTHEYRHSHSGYVAGFVIQ